MPAVGNESAHLLARHRNDLPPGTLHDHEIGPIHEMDGEGVLLPPDRKVKDAEPGDQAKSSN